MKELIIKKGDKQITVADKEDVMDALDDKSDNTHSHGNLQNDGRVGTISNTNKNVVTDGSGKITTEAKPTIPTKTSQLTNDSNFTTATGHNHDGVYLKSYTPPTASTSQAGIVQLSTSTSGTSTSKAATESAVAAAYSLANGKPNLGITATTAAKGDHNHDSSYLQKIGEVSQNSNGNITLPRDYESTNGATGNIPISANVDKSNQTLTNALPTLKSLIGSIKDSNSKWWNIISSRHRNGSHDGDMHGFYLKSLLTDDGDLIWNKQYKKNSGDTVGTWVGEKTILDSGNYSNYANKTTVSNSLTDTSTTNALSANQGKILNDRYKGVTFASSGNNTAKPYYRLFNITSGSGDSRSSRLIFEISSKTSTNYGRFVVYIRQNTSTSASTIDIQCIEKVGLNLNDIFVGFRNNYPNTSCDIYIKVQSLVHYIIKVIDDQLREGTYIQYSPTEGNIEAYTSIDDASTQLYGSAYTNIINPTWNIVATTIQKSGGTSSQFLKANGSAGTIVNDLTTGGTGDVLSAEQGKWLYNNKASSTHSHSYLPLSGGTVTGGIIYPQLKQSTQGTDNLPYAGTFDWNTDILTTVKERKSLLGTATDGARWWSVLSIRHRNGTGDGNKFGMILKAPLTTETSEENANLTWQRDLNGTTTNEKILIDNENMVKNSVVNNVLSHAQNNTSTAGYFKMLTIRAKGGYVDSCIKFSVYRRRTRTTNVELNFKYYQKDTSSSYYYQVDNFYYDGQNIDIYIKQTSDNVADATFDIYVYAEAWSDTSITPIVTNNSRNIPDRLIITPKNELVSSLPSGYTQATRNPNYVVQNHATTATTYGGGNASNYGHVKLSDAYTSSGGAASASVGASSKAVADAYSTLNTNKADKSSYVACTVTYTDGSTGTINLVTR